MIFNVHAGHNPDGKVACGAIGIVQESTENRKIKDEVIRQLRALGHTVYDCTVDNGTGASDVLKKIVAKCNEHTVDIDVSIHLNSSRNDYTGDGKQGGTEIFVYKATSKALDEATRMAQAFKASGYRLRSDKTSPAEGVKLNSKLYVLRNTNAPAMLIECCFVDDKDDIDLYDYRTVASNIVYGLTGQRYTEQPATGEQVASGVESATGNKDALYRVQVGAYTIKGNADAMKKRLQDAGFDAVVVKA